MRHFRPQNAPKETIHRTERLKVISRAPSGPAGVSFEPAGPVRPGFENRSSPWWRCGRPQVRSAVCREAGIPTPGIRCLVGLIHDIEDGRRPMAYETFEILIQVCQAAQSRTA